MKHKTTMLALVASLLNSASAFAGSESYNFGDNNNNVMRAQSSEVKSEMSGDVKIDFYGHMAFKITSPDGLTVMLDPWRNDPTEVFGVWYENDFPEVPVDIVLSSHAHFDHDAIYRTHATMNLERMAGNFELGDVKITGVADKHQCHAPGEINWTAYLKETFKLDLDALCPDSSPMAWDNVVYVIETGGMRIGFWGDNRPNPGPAAAKALENLDVLIMNVDGSGHILSYEQVDAALDRFNPSIVIPGHYLGAANESSTLKSADEWVGKQKHVVRLNGPTMTLNQATVEGKSQEVHYFGRNFISE